MLDILLKKVICTKRIELQTQNMLIYKMQECFLIYLTYLIKARGDSGYISVVIAFWSGSYSGTSSPDIIFVYNKGFSYTASNNTGTIAFDMTCNTIDVIPLMNV